MTYGAEAGDAFEVETYGELIPSVRREWLLTNGLGGYACGTVANVNTRRYHSTLVAANSPPLGRILTVARWQVALVDDAGVRHELWASHFRTGLQGDGPRLLRRFLLDGEVARWEYDASGHKLFQELFVAWHRNVSAVTFRVVPVPDHPSPLRLEVTPLVALRRHHDLRHTTDAEFVAEVEGDGSVAIRQRDLTCRIRAGGPGASATTFARRADWWYAHSYPMETARGLDDREDLYAPGTFTYDPPADAEAGDAVTFWVGLGELPELDLATERRRRRDGLAHRPAPTTAQRRLHRAAADFVVRRRRPDGMPGTTVIAGYPWSGDWGRDTFIALPGLLLSTGRHDVAGQVLSTFAHYAREGVIPNRFDDETNEPAYDTADASLWFVNAAFAYLRATRDRETFNALLLPACEDVIEGYTAGTHHGVAVDPRDGLLTAGDETTSLTWMDAVTPGGPVSPRHGKAVELNALWYNALRLIGRDADADRGAKAFNEAFVLGGGGGLADVVRGGPGGYRRDTTLRPNQIFAVSLEHSPLSADVQHEVVDVVRRRLLTPYGLRTLDRDARGYSGRYTGSPNDRARASHNGTVWLWLIGPFLDAHLKTQGHNPQSVRRARTWLRPLIEHVEHAGCIGSVGELVDAEYPYRPGGCFAQAWSVAEVLRLAVALEM